MPLPRPAMRLAKRGVLLILLVSSGLTTAKGQAASGDNRFTLHGYLTQAYARSDSLPLYGITRTGRADYRLMVLQLRYAISDDDEFVTQLRHRHFGASPLALIEPEITVSWAFYRRRVGPTNVRVGRIPLEQGLYSETRFVGTIVPFFRAPISLYPEGIESLDGASVSYTTPTVAGWSVQGTASGGSTRFKDVILGPTGTTVPVDFFFHLDYTGQLWVNTPIPGLRVGGTIHTFNTKTDTTPSLRNQIHVVSVDGTFDRFFVRGEHNQMRVPSFQADAMSHYVQGGVEVFGPLSVVYQYDFVRFNFATPFGILVMRNLDRAGGVVYAMRSNLHLKLERHRAHGYQFGQFSPLTGPPLRSDYTIGSFSVSF